MCASTRGIFFGRCDRREEFKRHHHGLESRSRTPVWLRQTRRSASRSPCLFPPTERTRSRAFWQAFVSASASSETTRQRKDGTHVEISLTVSPIKDERGRVVGASKIARDITERRRAEEQRRLLLREMDHRVKNMLALAGGLVSVSARSETTVGGLNSAVLARLAALGKAHRLVLQSAAESGDPRQATTTHCMNWPRLSSRLIGRERTLRFPGEHPDRSRRAQQSRASTS